MGKKTKKILSLFLSLVMTVTMITVPDMTVKASYDAGKGLNVYFKYTGSDDEWTTVALNTWNDTTVTALDGSILENVSVLAWGATSAFPEMSKNDKDWYEAKVTGKTLAGIDFVYPVNGDSQTNSSAKEAKDAANFLKLPADAESIYYVYDGTKLRAYSDEECTKELDSSIMLHIVNTENWDNVKVNYWGNISSDIPVQTELTANEETGWYDIKICPSNDSGSGFEFYTGNWQNECKMSGCFEEGVEEYWFEVVRDSSNNVGYVQYVKPTSVSLPETAEVSKGKTYKIPVTVSDRGFPGMAFTSSDENVATVDSTGTVTGVDEGTATITAQSLADGTIKATCEITVKSEIKVTEIKVSKETLELKKNQTTVLTAEVLPGNANNKEITWSSSDTDKVTVDAESGKVTAIEAGTATVTATAKDGSGVKGTCSVTVLSEETTKVSSIEFEGELGTLIAGDMVELKAKVSTENADYFNISYKSSNENAATVSEKGVVTAVGVGTAVITANTDNDAEGFTGATCNITVGDKYSLRSDLTGWDEKDEYSFRYTGQSAMQMKSTLELKKGFYSFQCAADGWNKKLGDGKQYEIYVNKDTVATVTISYATKPDASDAQLIFTGTNADDITTEIPEVKDIYTVVGAADGEPWDWYGNDKLMLLNESTGLYEYTWTGLEAGKKYIYQLAQDGATFGYKYQINNKGENFSYTPETPGSLYITYDKEKNEVSQEFQPSVTGVALDKETAEVIIGETVELTAAVTPEGAKNKNVSWSSDNEDVAVVKDGVVTAKSAGKAKITVTTEEGQKTAVCEVTVKPIAVTGVSLDADAKELTVGATDLLTETVTPPNATDKSVVWTTSDEKVATVKDGVVTAVGVGEAIITITTTDGAKTDSCTITVKPVAVTGISLNNTNLGLVKGKTSVLTAVISPANATDKSVTWTTSDENVATVKEGSVTAVGVGTAVITVTTKDGGKTASCTVNVSETEIPITAITISKTSAELTVGGNDTLTYTVTPADANNSDSVEWTTSDGNVATVKDGVVTAVGVGTATIKVTVNGTFTGECEVTVKAAVVSVLGIRLDKTEADLTEGETITLEATILPENAANKSYTWTTSNEEVASVKDGVVTAIAEGTATITVTAADGGKTAECKINVKKAVVPVSGINLDKAEADLIKGETVTLKATVLPENATDKTYTWLSSDERVATVKDGVVTAVAEGNAIVTVTTTDGKKTAECKINVKPEVVSVTGISLDKTELELTKGQTSTLKAAIIPENATDKTYTWSSSDEKVATVKDGVVTAVAEGNAIVTVTTADGKKTAECKVNVKPQVVSVTGISLDKTELELIKGQTSTLKAAIIPENATDKTYTWSSSDEKVATVKDGVITAVKEGNAVITVTTADGKKTAECKVTVKPQTVYYTVTFKDGTKVLDTQTVESGKAAKAPAGIKKTGYTLSWNKKFSNITADTTINAVWTANKYTVRFNGNGGTVSKKSKAVTYASKYGSLPTAKRKGYTFSGWYTSKTGGKKVTSSAKVSTAKTHTLYARWTKVKVAKVSIKSLKAGKKKATVTFKKVSGAKGYEIVYAANSKFKSAKKLTVTSTKADIKKLNSKSTIYVKVRAYKIDSAGKKVYGSYSSVKKVKIK